MGHKSNEYNYNQSKDIENEKKSFKIILHL